MIQQNNFCLKYPFVISYFENKYGMRKYYDDIDHDIIKREMKNELYPIIDLVLYDYEYYMDIGKHLEEFELYKRDFDNFLKEKF